MNKPAQNSELSDFEVRLQRLWKGTLLVGVVGGYALLISLLLVEHGWRAALLALFFVVLAQFLRYIANDVDRIGWRLSRQQDLGEGDNRTSQAQLRLLRVLIGLAQLVNVALIGQAYWLSGIVWAVPILLGLVFIEFLFSRIRKVNRRVDFAEASYGFRDRSMLRDGPRAGDSEEAKRAALERKLETLERLAESGQISQRAYEKARDKHRVRHVMRANDSRFES